MGPIIMTTEHGFWVGTAVQSRDAPRGGVVDRASQDAEVAFDRMAPGRVWRFGGVIQDRARVFPGGRR